MIDNTNNMNEYPNENLPSINVPAANDDETLNNITFGTLKQWLTTTCVENVAHIDMRLSKEISNIKKDLEVTESNIANTNTEIQQVKKEFSEFRKSTRNEVTSLEARTKALEDRVEKQKNVSDNNLKYLINADRNERKLNNVIFGVPEIGNNLELNGRAFITDRKKCGAIFEYIGGPVNEQVFKDMFRLGKLDAVKTRPIKIRLSSNNEVSSILKESQKLKDLVNLNIYIKPDKTKAEVTEFQRLGERKQELLNMYPVVEENILSRVVLKNGILTVKVEVDKFKLPQTLF